MGEVFGRQISFFISLSVMAAFLAGSAGARNIWTLCIFRYTIDAASVLAANTVLRSVFGALFPIVSIWMYDRLWDSLGPVNTGILVPAVYAISICVL